MLNLRTVIITVSTSEFTDAKQIVVHVDSTDLENFKSLLDIVVDEVVSYRVVP